MSPWLDGLTEAELEWVEDRAAFLQHGLKLPRAQAEKQAVLEIRDRKQWRAREQAGTR